MIFNITKVSYFNPYAKIFDAYYLIVPANYLHPVAIEWIKKSFSSSIENNNLNLSDFSIENYLTIEESCSDEGYIGDGYLEDKYNIPFNRFVEWGEIKRTLNIFE